MSLPTPMSLALPMVMVMAVVVLEMVLPVVVVVVEMVLPVVVVVVEMVSPVSADVLANLLPLELARSGTYLVVFREILCLVKKSPIAILTRRAVSFLLYDSSFSVLIHLLPCHCTSF